MSKQKLLKNSKKIMLVLASLSLVATIICGVLISTMHSEEQAEEPVMTVRVLNISSFDEANGEGKIEEGENEVSDGSEAESEKVTVERKTVAGKDSIKAAAKYTNNSKTYINSSNTVTLQLDGTDETKIKTSSLTATNIVVKVGGTAVTPTTKNLSEPTQITGGYRYTLTLSGIPGNGALTIEIAAETLTDQATNKSGKAVFDSNDPNYQEIIIDNQGPGVTFGTNGNTTYAKSRSTTVTVNDNLSGVVANSLKYVWTNSTTAPAEESSFTGTFTSGGTISTPANVSGNNWYLWILAKDNVGNVSKIKSNAFYLDNTPPSLSLAKETYQEGFDGWNLSTGASIDGDGVLTMAQAGTVDTKNYRINGEFWYPTLDAYTSTAKQSSQLGGVNWVSSYYDNNLNPSTSNEGTTGNGWSYSIGLNSWENNINWYSRNPVEQNPRYGENVKNVKLQFVTGNENSKPPVKIRNFKMHGQLYSSFYDITVTPQDNSNNISKIKYAKGSQNVAYFANAGENVDLTTKTFRVTENATYTVYVEDSSGNGAVQTIVVDKIDVNKPGIQAATTAQYGDNVTVTFTDNLSGVTDWQITNSSTAPTTGGWKHIAATTNGTVTATTADGLTVGKKYIWTMDAAGNKESKEITVHYKVTYSKGTHVSAIGSTGENNTTGTITLPAITAETGYTVLGWYNGDTKFGNAGESKAISNNITLTAKVEATKYTLTADAKSGTIASTTGWTGTGATATKQVTYDAAYGTLPSVSRTGYTLKGWTVLPDGYEQVEYVQSTGNQYLDTGTKFNSNTDKFELSYSADDATKNYFIAGSGWQENGKIWVYSYANGKTISVYITDTSGSQKTFTGISGPDTSKHLITYDAKKLYVDNVLKTDNSQFTFGETPYNFSLFNAVNSSGHYAKTKIYGFKMWRAGVLTRNMIPCINTSTGKAGFYDLVEGQFYGKSAGDDLVAGNKTYLSAETIVSTAGNHTIRAVWEANKYKVTYDANGGTGAPAQQTFTFNAGDKLSTTVPTRTGYSFVNWKRSDANYTFNPGATIPNGWGNFTLKAQWNANTYTVTYNGNGNTGGSTADSSHTYDTAKALTANGFTKTGYTFAGWNTKADGTGTSYTDKQSVTNLSSTNGATVTLYAKWTINKYNLTYNYNNNTTSFAASEYSDTGYKVNWNNDFEIESTVNIPTLGKRYLVVGSFDASSARELNIEFTTSNALRVYYGLGEVDTSNGTIYANEDIKVTFTWTASSKTYTITAKGTSTNIEFNGTRSIDSMASKTLRIGCQDNRGSVAFNPMTFKTLSIKEKMNYNTAITNPVATRIGYALDGWYSAATGGTKQANSFNLGAADATYYAHWTANTYTVAYNGNGATGGSTASSSHTYDTAKTLTANGFTKTGYDFAGWNTKEDGTGTSYTDKQSVTNLSSTNGATVTLFAKWTKHKYTITFNANGGTMNSSTSTTSYTQDYESTITMNNPTRTGYEFMGWVSDKRTNVTTAGYWTYTDSKDPRTGNNLELINATNHRLNGYAGGTAFRSNPTYVSGTPYAANKNVTSSTSNVNYSSSDPNPLNNISATSYYRITRTGGTDTNYAAATQITFPWRLRDDNLVIVIVARIDAGWSIEVTGNAGVAERKWLTSQAGTGNWQTYVVAARVVETGSYMNYGHLYLTKTDSSAVTNPKIDTAYLQGYYTNMQSSTAGVNKFKIGATNETLTALWRAVDQTVTVTPNNAKGSYKVTASNLFDKTDGLVTNTKLVDRGAANWTGASYTASDSTRFISGWIKVVQGATYKITGASEAGLVEWSPYTDKNSIINNGNTKATSYTNDTEFTVPTTNISGAACTYTYMRFHALNSDINNIKLEMTNSSTYTTTQTLYFPNNATVNIISTPNTGYSTAVAKSSGLGTFTTSTSGSTVTGTLTGLAGNKTTTQVAVAYTANNYTATFLSGNLLSGIQLSQTGSDTSSISNGVYTMTKTSTYGGYYIPASRMTAGKTYILSYKIQKSSGTLTNIGGHSAGATQVAFTIDGANSSGTYGSPGTNMSAKNDTNAHQVVFKFTYNANSSDNNIYIQPNRGLSTSVTVNISEVTLYEVVEERTKAYETQLGTLPTASRTGFTPGGWYDAASGGNAISTSTTMPLNGATYYQHWTPHKLTVKIYANGATKNSDGNAVNELLSTEVLNYDGTVGYNWPTDYVPPYGYKLVKEGHTADGKYHIGSGSSTTTIGQDLVKQTTPVTTIADSLGVLSDLKAGDKEVGLYAGWTINTYTITRNAYKWKQQSSSWEKFDTETTSLQYNSSYDVTSHMATTPTGYKLNNSTGNMNWSTNGYQSSQGTNPFTVTTNTEVHIHYYPNTYTIAYTLNGGTAGANAPTSGTYDVDVSISNPTRTGYTFTGWTATVGSNAKTGTAANPSTAWDGTATKNTYFKNLTDTNGATVTLIANWTPVQYTITLDRNSGTGGTASVTSTYDAVLPNITAPTRAGYTFKGYYSNKTAFDLVAAVADLSSTSKRINFTNAQSSANGWAMTTDDAGTHIQGKIKVTDSTLTTAPTLDFNDGTLTARSATKSGNDWIIYVDFDIPSSFNYSTNYRFIDVNGIKSSSTVTVEYLTKGGKKYYNNSGTGVYPSDFTAVGTIYARWVDETKPTAPTWVAKYKSDNSTYTSGDWTNSQVYTTISTTEAGSGIEEMQYSYDKSTWTKLGFGQSSMTQSGTTWTGGEYWGLVNRDQTAYFRAKDKAGNYSEISTGFTVRYDISPPTVTISPNGQEYTVSTTSTNVSTTVTAADTGGSTLNKLQYAWSTSNSTEPTSWTDFTNGSAISASKSGGVHYLWLNITDKAGNRCATKVSSAFTVNTPPVITANPTDVTVKAGTNATFSTTVTNGYPTSNTYQWQKQSNIQNGASGTTATKGTDDGGNYFTKTTSDQWHKGIMLTSTTVTPGKTYTWCMEVKSSIAVTTRFDANCTAGGYSGNDAAMSSTATGGPSTIPANTWTKVWLTVTVKSDATSPYLHHAFCPTVSADAKVYYRNLTLTEESAWSNISGATSSSYTVSAPTTDSDNTVYRCVISNTKNTVKTAPAILNVLGKPSVSLKLNNNSGSTYTSGSWTKENVFHTITTAGESIYKYQYSHNNSDWTTIPSTWNLSKTDNTATYLINWAGQWNFYIRGIDYSGNATASSDMFTLRIEKTAPTVTAYAGTMLYTDPTFASGENGTKRYDNNNSGKTTVTRTAGTTPEGNYYLKIVNTGSGTNPNLGGFYFANQSAANKVFVTRIVAKIPVGYTLNWHTNAIGDGRTNTWLTDTAGTGDWEEYINVTVCGSTGSFSSTSFFSLSGTAGTASAPVEWDVAYATVFDTTKWAKEQYVVSGAKDTSTKKITGYGMNQSNSTQPSYTTLTEKQNYGKATNITANGTYYAWYKDALGNANKAAATASYVDTAAPTFTSCEIKNISSTGYDVYIYGVTDNNGSGVNRVQFPTWTENNGQDDIQSSWSTNTAAKGTLQSDGTTWVYHVNTTDHKNEAGKYITHIYLYDNLGNSRSTSTAGSGAVTVPTVTATFNSNGGLAASPETITKAYNNDLGTLPTASRHGYNFAGWFTAATGGTQISDTTKMPATDTTYYAHWTKETYTISYTMNNGSISGQKTSYDVDTATFTLPTPTKSGWTFTGWSGTGLTGNTNTTVTVTKGSTGNRSYTAHWSKAITLTQMHGGTTKTEQSYTMTDSETSHIFTLVTSQNSYSGWTFDGWLNNATPKAPDYGKTGTITISDSKTVYATYYHDYTATFIDYNGTTKQTRTSTARAWGNASAGGVGNQYGSITIPAQSTYTGWTPGGWTTQTGADATKEKDSSASLTLSSSPTYYGIYSQNVTLTYSANGGSSTPTAGSGTRKTNSYSISTLSNPTFTMANAITRVGYTFGGWAVSAPISATKAAGTTITPASGTALTATAVWSYSTTPQIVRSDYNTFSVSATAGSRLFISKTQTTKPASNASGWVSIAQSGEATQDVSITAKETWYVWVHDSAGTVSPNSATITNYKVTYTIATGTIGKMTVDSASGTNLANNNYVLSGTPVYPLAQATTGYSNAVVKVGSETITAGSSKNITADTTFTSSATANTYTVTYNGNGATGGSTAKSTHTYDTAKALTTNGFSRTGYTFTGWSTNSGDVVKCYDNGEYSKDNTSGTGSSDFKSYTIEPTFTSGDIYQLDVDVKGSGTLYNFFYGPSGYMQVGSWVSYKADGTSSSGTNTDGYNQIPLTSSYTHYTVRFTLKNSGNGELAKYILFRAPAGCNATVKNVRVNKVTSSSRAYSDGQSVKNLATSGNINLYALWVKNNYQITNTGIYYETLNSAFYAATNNQTVKAMVGVTETKDATLPAGKTGIKFDLGGKTTTFNDVALINNGTLDIYSSVANGKITGSGKEGLNVLGINCSTLVINNGTLTTNATSSTNVIIFIVSSNKELIICNNSGKNLTLNSNTKLIENDDEVTYSYYALGIFNMGNSTIDGAKMVLGGGGITNACNSNLIINSANIDTGGPSIYNYNNDGTGQKSTIVISGTEETTIINGNYPMSGNGVIKCLAPVDLTINGGKLVNRTESIVMDSGSSGSTINIKGGSMPNVNINVSDVTLTIGTNDGSISINSPKITGGIRKGIAVVNSGTINFYDGIIQADASSGTFSHQPNSVPSGGYGVCTTTADGITTSVIRKGDVNSDKIVNQTDLSLLQQYINGTSVTIDTTAADVDSSGSINMKDVTLLQSYLNGDLTIN